MSTTSRATQRQRRPASVGALLLLASTASATSLADFQILTSSNIPLGCILAYDATILGCSKNDFERACSSGCMKGLQVTEALIEAACNGVDVESNSLLGEALSGDLVDALCATGKTTTTSTSLASHSSTAAVVITATSKTIPTLTRGSFTVIPTPSTTSSSSVETSTTTSDTSTTDSSTTTSTEESTSTTSVDASPVQTTSAETKTTSTFKTTSTTTTHTSSSQQAQATRGGGSPFDATVDNIGSVDLGMSWSQSLLVSVICGLLLLR